MTLQAGVQIVQIHQYDQKPQDYRTTQERDLTRYLTTPAFWYHRRLDLSCWKQPANFTYDSALANILDLCFPFEVVGDGRSVILQPALDGLPVAGHGPVKLALTLTVVAGQVTELRHNDPRQTIKLGETNTRHVHNPNQWVTVEFVAGNPV